MSEERTIERNWLYNEVWKRPATKIAADLGISSSLLKRICIAMDIPTPKAGHWVQLEFGKKISIPELPIAADGIRTSWTIDPANSAAQKARIQKVKRIQKEIESSAAEQELPVIEISKDLENLHPLVVATRAQVRENAKQNLAWSERKNRRRLNAQVSIASLDRTCLILDTLVRACEAAGYIFRSEQDGKKSPKRSPNSNRYDQPDEPSGICWIEAHGEKIDFWIKEKNQRVYLPEEKQSYFHKYDDVPSGMLECVLGGAYHSGGRTNWRDGKVQRVENLLPLMIAEIPVIAEAKKIERDRQARRELYWKYQREMWDFDSLRKGLQANAIKKIIEHATQHQSANVVRQYFEAVKKQFCSGFRSDDSNGEMEEWIRWAEKTIEALDPIKRSSPPWEHDSFVEMLKNLSIEPPKPPDDYDKDL